MPETNSQRAARFRPHVGKRVTVTLIANNFNDDVLTLTGHVHRLALRVKGTADFRGAQYDMVLDCDDRVTRVFALSRILGIEEAP